MQLKSAKLLFIIVMIISSVLLISGCGKSGNRFANQPPTIQITSFEAGIQLMLVPVTIQLRFMNSSVFIGMLLI